MTLSRDALNDIRLLVFDLDGTLIDSMKDLALSVNATREWMGLPRLPNETIARAHMLDHTAVYDGVREALEELKDRKLAVLTNKPVAFSRAILAGLKLADHFAFVYGGNSFEQKKPDPVGVIKLMSDTGALPRETVMVGDSDTDVLTGRNAGVWTCGVTYGLGSHTLERAAPDVLVGDLRELPPLLNGERAAQSTPHPLPLSRKGRGEC